jgi:hypothetical protein
MTDWVKSLPSERACMFLHRMALGPLHTDDPSGIPPTSPFSTLVFSDVAIPTSNVTFFMKSTQELDQRKISLDRAGNV